MLAPAHTKAPAPLLTAALPLCLHTNPSLTGCLAVQDPAAVLNQWVTALEQREEQIIAALQQLAQKVDVKKNSRARRRTARRRRRRPRRRSRRARCSFSGTSGPCPTPCSRCRCRQCT